ncbi:hydrogenase maturation protein [Hoeflea sp. TYP-13]|uniref:hydrogenase maturation protein n=1 Tax=Hoeflea sp. TYP-13 TaxID=3230023 RepID=UPI0034C66EBC
MMRVLLLCHSFNSLSQRLHAELRAAGYDVSVELDINDAVAQEAVRLHEPDVIVAPFLKRAIPQSVWQDHICLIVHPGPVGDSGPSSLDWAVAEGRKTWGVTVLQAEEELDAGPVWAHRKFPMRKAPKSSLYRHEVTEAAVEAVFEALGKIGKGDKQPISPDAFDGVERVWRNAMRQSDRKINWSQDEADTVVCKINAADGMPGVLDELFGEPVYLFNARPAPGLNGAQPGQVVAKSGKAIAQATCDGAVWIGHVRVNHPEAIKLPATHVFATQSGSLPERSGYREISYVERGPVGFLNFAFYNGAMGTGDCEELLAAYRNAIARPTKVLVLMGGPDHWSNGLNLNLIEDAESPADESWRNINAMDDLTEAVIRTTDKFVISAICGNAGAGGVFLARAADEVWLRAGAILNPHYKDMGNLYGSEYWTYLLPMHVGAERAEKIAAARLPMGAEEARALGLADLVLNVGRGGFDAEVERLAGAAASDAALDGRLKAKAERRNRDEAVKPLSAYRTDELSRMKRNFYGFDPSYHVARYNFVRKVPKSRTPLTLARHRAGGAVVRRAGEVA